MPSGFPKTMRLSLFPALPVALLAATPGAMAAAPGSVTDFRLPEATQIPAEPDRQGPVAPDVPESRAPAPTPAATAPAPRPRPATTSVPTPGPAITLPVPSPAQSALPTAPNSPVAAPVITPSPTTASETAALPQPVQPAPLPAPAPPTADGPSAPTIVLGGVLVLALLGLAALVWRRRRQGAADVPLIEPARPIAAPTPTPAPAPVPAAPEPQPALTITLLPPRLSLTLVNAALEWRVDLHNRSGDAIDGIVVAADMISAHADLPAEDRASGPAPDADAVTLGRIAAGDRAEAGGTIRLPFPRITPIWHGEVALLMPMLRLRISAAGTEPMTRVYLVGQPSLAAGDTLQPFRLDLGPRVYPDLAHRPFA